MHFELERTRVVTKIVLVPVKGVDHLNLVQDPLLLLLTGIISTISLNVVSLNQLSR